MTQARPSSGDGRGPARRRLAPDGDLEATITRTVAQPDGVRLDLRVAHGTVRAWHPDPEVAVGDRVRIDIVGGVRFDEPRQS